MTCLGKTITKYLHIAVYNLFELQPLSTEGKQDYHRIPLVLKKLIIIACVNVCTGLCELEGRVCVKVRGQLSGVTTGPDQGLRESKSNKGRSRWQKHQVPFPVHLWA